MSGMWAVCFLLLQSLGTSAFAFGGFVGERCLGPGQGTCRQSSMFCKQGVCICDAGTYGSLNETACTACPVGKWSAPWASLYFNASSCISCPAGTSTGIGDTNETWSPLMGQSSFYSCRDCPANMYSPVPGSECLHCTPPTVSLMGSKICLVQLSSG